MIKTVEELRAASIVESEISSIRKSISEIEMGNPLDYTNQTMQELYRKHRAEIVPFLAGFYYMELEKAEAELKAMLEG